MSHIRHNSGLSEQVSELGFDAVKFFGGSITTVPFTLSISPPARKLTVRNTSTSVAVFLRVNNGDATDSISLTPGDDLKISPTCTFEMDFDTLNEVSLVTTSGTAVIEGLLGWKGTAGC